MDAVQTESEKQAALTVLNEDPKRFLNGSERGIVISGARHTVALDKIKGGILVWGDQQVHRFRWDKEAELWV